MAKAGQLIDFTRPVALMFVAVLHCIPDEDDPAAIAARYLAALAPGSYLVLSHSTDEFAPDRTHQASAEAKERGEPHGSRAARTPSCACSTAGNSLTPALCSSPTGELSQPITLLMRP